jgi:hypothetical protein
MRATMSRSVTALEILSAARFRKVSPAAWPDLSLICLKPSRSKCRIAILSIVSSASISMKRRSKYRRLGKPVR